MLVMYMSCHACHVHVMSCLSCTCHVMLVMYMPCHACHKHVMSCLSKCTRKHANAEGANRPHTCQNARESMRMQRGQIDHTPAKMHAKACECRGGNSVQAKATECRGGKSTTHLPKCTRKS